MPTTQSTSTFPATAAAAAIMTSSATGEMANPPAATTRPGACLLDQECKEMRKERHERQTRQWNATLEELRVKLERDKHDALNTQKEAMNRTFRVQLAKMIREKEELGRKLQAATEAAQGSASSTSGELQKLAHENALLRGEKKKLEDQFQMLKESEQSRYTNMRSQLDEKSCQLSNWQKQSRQQITRLREETRTKDRVISHLEAELRVQTGRAQQFRDLLEQNLTAHTSSNCSLNRTGHQQQQHEQQQQQQQQREREELVARQRKLQIQVEDLQEAMRQQQETFANEKRELLRRLNETERQQSPLRQKSKQYLTRNVQLSAKNKELEETLKKMQEDTPSSITSTSLKRSLTRPNLTRLGTPPQTNDKQRRMEYVQQVQKLRKEQRYYSMWELPPLLEVETDSAADVSDSSDSGSQLSPTATSSSGVNSSCASDAWSEETRRELEVLFSQLSREHSELQRSYQMLHEKLRQLTCFSETDVHNVNYATLQADYNAARARIRDLEEILQLKNNQDQVPRTQSPSLLEIQAKFVREKHTLQTQMAILSHRLEDSKQRCTALQAELNEARDQNELLEFRILELEECQERTSSRCSTPRDRKDVCTDTDSDDLSVGDSGITSLASFPSTADCPPSPVSDSSAHASIPDGDYLNEKIAAVKSDLESLLPCLSDASHKSVLDQLQALLGLCQNRLSPPPVKSTPNSSPLAAEQSGWDWPLQESGIFEGMEETSLEAATQTDAVPLEYPVAGSPSTVDAATETYSFQTMERQVQVGVASAAVLERCVQTEPGHFSRDQYCQYEVVSLVEEQTIGEVRMDSLEDSVAIGVEVGVEADIETRDQGVQWVRFEPEPTDVTCQTEEDVISLKDFRDIEDYYVQQIELLQKEKCGLRKHSQTDRDELTHRLEQMSVQLQELQEREAQFEQVLLKHRQFYDRELELARQSATDQLSNLKECLQLVWHEIKDCVADGHAPASCTDDDSVLEFTQHLINAVQRVCAELGQLRGKVLDLADMEKAFQTTLQQADGLVSHIEQRHLQRIRELELSENELRAQLEQQQQQQPQQQQQGQPQAAAVAVYSPTEVTEYLESKIKELESENDMLNAQLTKHQEVQDRCQQLRHRVEELEQLDKNLKSAVQDAERRFQSREQRYRQELDSLREELDANRQNETSWHEQLEQKERLLIQLRVELDEEHKTVICLENDIKQLHCKLEKDDTSFRNEVTKLRSQLNISMVQLNELESLNCQLREQILQQQSQMAKLQRNLEEEESRCQELMVENSRLLQAQADIQKRPIQAAAKPLTLELFEAELDEPEADEATLDDFREISLPNTPTVLDGCSDVFEEHFKVLESLESYLETQHLVVEETTDESGVSMTTTPSVRENDQVSLLEAQVSQLRSENHSLLNTYTAQSAAKDDLSNIIHLLIDQLKTNAPHQSLVKMAHHIRQMSSADSSSAQTVCRLLESSPSSPPEPAPTSSIAGRSALTNESTKLLQSVPAAPVPVAAPVFAAVAAGAAPVSALLEPTMVPYPKVAPRTITVLPEQDPLLSPATDLRVTRRVGQDGLVVAWLPSPDQECAGYLICVNAQEAQRVRSAQRTKAVLCGLDLQQEMEICIYSLSTEGRISVPARASYHPELDPLSMQSAQATSLSSVAVYPASVTSESDADLSLVDKEDPSPREVVVQTFYTNSSVTVRSSRRVATVNGSRIPLPVRSGLP